MAATEVHTTLIVAHLIEEPILLSNWKSFCRVLHLKEPTIEQLKRRYQQDNNVEDLLTDILHEWIAKHGSGATIWELILALTAGLYVYAADKLKDNFIGPEGKMKSYYSNLRVIPGGHSIAECRINSLKNYLWYQNGRGIYRPELRFAISDSQDLDDILKLLLSGPPNTGKTELARHFAFKLHRGEMRIGGSNERHGCVWINANNLSSELQEFKTYCGIQGEDSTFINLFTKFRDRKWVMIFDEVDNPMAMEQFRSFMDTFRQIPMDDEELPRIFATSRTSPVGCFFKFSMDNAVRTDTGVIVINLKLVEILQ